MPQTSAFGAPAADEPGDEVEGFAVGDLAGVGSCRTCASCGEGLEQYCENGPPILTYGGIEKETGRMTHGGYSKAIVVDQDEMISMDQIDAAYDRMMASDVKYRFVIDMESMPAAA